jgi:hypothetical protein
LIVGTLGFVGVIITMLANAYMQRKQHERKIQHEANSLRVALKTELSANRQSFEGRIKRFEEPEEIYTDAIVQNRSNDKIYNELLSNIGLLTEQEVEMVTEAYALLAEIPYRIRIIVGTDGTGGYSDEFIRIPKEHHETVTKMHQMAVPIISQAIDAINGRLRST